jgi:hypothetical protein
MSIGDLLPQKLDRRAKKSIRDTNACYKRAFVEVHRAYFTRSQIKRLSLKQLKTKFRFDWAPGEAPDPKPKEVNELYLKYLLELTTKQLNTVVDLHNKGVMTRAEVTIAAIMTELFERSVNSETKEKHEQ